MADNKRLIDANKIKYTEYRGGGGREYPENVVTDDEIAKMPTVDAVEVVRCKECKRCFKHTTKRNKQTMWLCMRNEMEVCVRPDDFCSYGERKEGADND